MAKIISGKELSATIRREIAENAGAFAKKHGRIPGLSVIIVGNDPASLVYVRNKHKACEECGFYSQIISLPEDISEDRLLYQIDLLNANEKIDGILVQLPLPSHIREEAVINRISPEKDVDVFHPINVGRMTTGTGHLFPCTPSGVMEMLRRSGISVEGKRCVVVGRSNIVGKPMSQMLLAANGTVTTCHSKTTDLKSICLTADILVSAVGKINIITADMVKPGAVVIDIGINRRSDGSICGDVDFENVVKISSYISPVPGGVGPMTITMLMKNTLLSAENRMREI